MPAVPAPPIADAEPMPEPANASPLPNDPTARALEDEQGDGILDSEDEADEDDAPPAPCLGGS